MRGMCSVSGRTVGDKEEYDILFTRDNFPICACHRAYVLLFDEGDEDEGRGD